ncbi:hypothetical protein GCM10009760_03350 [Kitasatospora kazusensis]|uniref:Dolichyl-phosphate-mannose-protein mannosyltransferase n=1 Tax=Kitasatospora kazusensis TaxID=407974 RepID=A0ABP5KG55_9ACTN
MPETVASPGSAPGRLLERAVRRIPSDWRLPLGVLAGTQAIWLVWWAAYYPALLSFDSVMYTWQVTTGNVSSDHSVLYDGFVWLALHLPGQFGLLTLLQTTAASACLAYACVAMRDLGVRARWTVPAALLTAAFPSTGAFVVYVWKDVPFTLCGLLVFAASARLIALRKLPVEGAWWRPGSRRFDLLMLATSLLGLGLFRNNGVGVALVAGLALVLVLPGLRVRVSALVLAAVVIPVVCQLWLFSAMGVKQPPSDAVFAMNYSDVAVAYQEASYLFTPADVAVLKAVAPMSTWKQGANCYSADALTNTSAPFDHTVAREHSTELVGMWTKVLKERPDIILGARICRGHIAWAPFSDRTAPGASTIIPGIARVPHYWGFTDPAGSANPATGTISPAGRMVGSPYLPALDSHPFSKKLNKAATWVNLLFRVPQLDWIIWRGATWCYLGYAALACYAIGRRRPAVYALGGVMLGLQLTLVAANPAELYRYNVVPLFIGPLCLGLIAARRGTEPRAAAEPVKEQREPAELTA